MSEIIVISIDRKGETSLPRFIVAAKDQASVKKTVFFRARHLVTEIEKSKLSLLHLLHTFVATLLKIVAGRGGPVSHVSKTLLHIQGGLHL